MPNFFSVVQEKTSNNLSLPLLTFRFSDLPTDTYHISCRGKITDSANNEVSFYQYQSKEKVVIDGKEYLTLTIVLSKGIDIIQCDGIIDFSSINLTYLSEDHLLMEVNPCLMKGAEYTPVVYTHVKGNLTAPTIRGATLLNITSGASKITTKTIEGNVIGGNNE